jgi:hypothetical protein
MSSNQLILLLTVARVLRGRVNDLPGPLSLNDLDDLEALNAALAPFDPAPTDPVNVEGSRHEGSKLMPPAAVHWNYVVETAAVGRPRIYAVSGTGRTAKVRMVVMFGKEATTAEMQTVIATLVGPADAEEQAPNNRQTCQTFPL